MKEDKEKKEQYKGKLTQLFQVRNKKNTIL